MCWVFTFYANRCGHLTGKQDAVACPAKGWGEPCETEHIRIEDNEVEYCSDECFNEENPPPTEEEKLTQEQWKAKMKEQSSKEQNGEAAKENGEGSKGAEEVDADEEMTG